MDDRIILPSLAKTVEKVADKVKGEYNYALSESGLIVTASVKLIKTGGVLLYDMSDLEKMLKGKK